MGRIRRPYLLPEPLTCSPDRIAAGVSLALTEEYIRKHEARMQRYIYLENMYKGFHDAYKQPEKPDWKPDNRLAVNFPRYITETFLGYAYGIPIKKTHPDERVDEAIRSFEDENEISDHEYELFRKACIYGHSWEYFYQDEQAHTKMTVCTPKELFVVYDDTMQKRALFAVRYGRHDLEGEHAGELYGEIMTRTETRDFDHGEVVDERDNPYGMIPCVEYRPNDERMGLYENVTGLVETYNHAIGEKANDVDAFADAYLAVLGAEIDEAGYYKIRDNRLINLYGTNDAKDILVQFLQKPTADGTQENLLNRLENLIYQTSMVANISDESFGSASSGVALAYKLQAMSNLALGFDRKNEKSLRKRYKIFCSLSTNAPNTDAWKDVKIQTTRNLPKNVSEEAQTAAQLSGIVSQETQLSVLSIVDNVREEIERIEAEEEKSKKGTVLAGMFGGAAGGQSEEPEESGESEQSGILETERGSAAGEEPDE